MVMEDCAYYVTLTVLLVALTSQIAIHANTLGLEQHLPAQTQHVFIIYLIIANIEFLDASIIENNF